MSNYSPLCNNLVIPGDSGRTDCDSAPDRESNLRVLANVRHQSEKRQRQQAAERADEDKPGHVCKLMGSDAQ